MREHYTVATPDERLRTCEAEPAKRPVTTQAAIATLFNELFAWGRDCQSKLGSTWKSIDDATARAATLSNTLSEDPD